MLLLQPPELQQELEELEELEAQATEPVMAIEQEWPGVPYDPVDLRMSASKVDSHHAQTVLELNSPAAQPWEIKEASATSCCRIVQGPRLDLKLSQISN